MKTLRSRSRSPRCASALVAVDAARLQRGRLRARRGDRPGRRVAAPRERAPVGAALGERSLGVGHLRRRRRQGARAARPALRRQGVEGAPHRAARATCGGCRRSRTAPSLMAGAERHGAPLRRQQFERIKHAGPRPADGVRRVGDDAATTSTPSGARAAGAGSSGTTATARSRASTLPLDLPRTAERRGARLLQGRGAPATTCGSSARAAPCCTARATRRSRSSPTPHEGHALHRARRRGDRAARRWAAPATASLLDGAKAAPSTTASPAGAGLSRGSSRPIARRLGERRARRRLLARRAGRSVRRRRSRPRAAGGVVAPLDLRRPVAAASGPPAATCSPPRSTAGCSFTTASRCRPS